MASPLFRWIRPTIRRVTELVEKGIGAVRISYESFQFERTKDAYIERWHTERKPTIELYQPLKRVARVREFFYGDEAAYNIGNKQMWAVDVHFVVPGKGSITVTVNLRFGEPFNMNRILDACTPDVAEEFFKGEKRTSSKVRAAYVTHISMLQTFQLL